MIRSSAVFLSVGIFALASAPADSEPLKVPYVSVSPNPAPLWIAHEAGLFKKSSLEVELVYIPGGTVIIQAMLSGDVKWQTWRRRRRSGLGSKGPTSL
ncbi:MAG TPA: hypothetical protein VNN77_05580 [candidate division Zixibacteria bacterium]|nr:hypothetical protein [candidate division Zixibacteria bacterium]